MAKKEKEKVKAEAMAVIDIGSNELRLRIAENIKGKMKFLEHISYPLSLGRDTWSGGKIQFERVEKTCSSIKNFLAVISEYGVTRFRAVATTAIRESENRDYILDQIKIKTLVTIDVLDDAEEKLYIYKLTASLVDPGLLSSAMMVYFGSGNIGISAWTGGKAVYSQNIKIGSLRIMEMFEDLQEYSGQFYTVVEDYLKGFIKSLELPPNIRYFIASGQEAAIIADLTNAKRDKIFLNIERRKLDALYEEIKYKTVNIIAEDYDLPADKAEVLLPAVLIYRSLLNLTEAEGIITPLTMLSDALMFEMLYPERFSEISKEFDKSTLIAVKAIAKKYMAHEGHYLSIEKHALVIFDRMKKIHGMGKREKLLLQTAAILHDIGKFINLNHHYRHSYNIITGSSIIGLNTAETEAVAQICLYHSRLTPDHNTQPYSNLSSAEKVLVSKLAAILRLADALDRSHDQKITDMEAVITEDVLTITATAGRNIDLEVWAFEEKAVMFEDVFGLKAVIKIKKVV